MNYVQMSYRQLKALPRDQLRQALVARREAYRSSLRGRLAHGIALVLLALGCVAAVASFFVKGINVNPWSAAGILLFAPAFGMELLGKKPGRVVKLLAYAGIALFVVAPVSQLIWQ